MPPEGGGTLQEILKLTRENNKMLHAMRRNAFLGGLLKFVFYIVILVVIPIWFYIIYLSPMLDQMLSTMNQIQSTGTQAQHQMLDWQKSLESIKERIPGFSSSSTKSQ